MPHIHQNHEHWERLEISNDRTIKNTQWNLLSIHNEDQTVPPANVFLAQPPCRSASESPHNSRGASRRTGVPLSASENWSDIYAKERNWSEGILNYLMRQVYLNGSLFFSFFFLREDQIAALYITKELPAWPASFSLLSDAAGLSISRRTFLL